MANCRRLYTVMLLASIVPTKSMKGSTSLDISPGSIQRLYDFGFLSGGSFTANFTFQSPFVPETGHDVLVAVCTEGELNDILTYGSGYHGICRSSGRMCGLAGKLMPPWGNYSGALSWAVSTSLPSAGQLYFVALSCFRSSQVVVGLTYECLNPGGEQLSSGQIPLKPLSLSMSSIWGALALAMMLGWGWAACAAGPAGDLPQDIEEQRLARQLASPVRPIHGFIWACAALSCVSASVSWSLWTLVSRQGVVPMGLAVGDVTAWDVSSAAVVTVLLAISRGWGITRLSLDGYETKAVASLTVLYFLAWCTWQYVGGLFALFTLVLTYVLIMRYLFYSLTYSLRILAIFRAYTASLISAAEAARARSSIGRSDSGERTPLTQGPAQAQPTTPLPREALEVDAETARLLASPAYGGLFDGQQQSQPSPQGKVHVAKDAPGRPSDSRAYGSLSDEDDGRIRPSWATPPDRYARSSRFSSWLRSAASSAYTSVASAVDFVTGTRGQYQHLEDGQGRAGQGMAVSDGSIQEGGLTTRQLHVLRWLRSAVVLYLSVDVLGNVWADMDLGAEPWVEFALQHTLQMAMVASLAWVLRPRADPCDSPLFDPRGYISAQDGVLEPLVGRLGLSPRARTNTGRGNTQDGQESQPRWLVVMGPDGQLQGAAGKADEAPLSVPVVDPASLPVPTRMDWMTGTIEGEEDEWDGRGEVQGRPGLGGRRQR